MPIRQLLKCLIQITPIQKALRSIERRPLGFRALNSLSGLDGVFPSFDQAWSVARRKRSRAHDDQGLIKGNLNLSLKTRLSDYPVLYWLNQIPKGGLTVFDYGGGAGQLFYQYSKFLRQGQIREWIVMDLPEVVATGMEVARQRGSQELRFSTSLSDSRGGDVFLAAGAFHYWEQTIRDLAEQTEGLPDHFIINRSPFREKGDAFVGMQHGRSWAAPFLARTPASIEREFRDLGYELVDSWRVLEKTFSPPLLPGHKAPYMGFYFRRSP
jgi:putative methyltransferase (TIGR04325 family)